MTKNEFLITVIILLIILMCLYVHDTIQSILVNIKDEIYGQ